MNLSRRHCSVKWRRSISTCAKAALHIVNIDLELN